MSQHTPGPPNAIKMTPKQEISMLLEGQLGGDDLSEETCQLIQGMLAFFTRMSRWDDTTTTSAMLKEREIARALLREIEGENH